MSEQPNPQRDVTISDATLSQSASGSSEGFVGPYRLIQKLGEGGMGEVWLAEQTAPIKRMVAVKLIKAGMDTAAVVARFESERQALALMSHPNIAKVFDAGSTPDGRPYFVMEYVSGIPINAYCDKYRLTVPERLELFTQVCDGVQHAHQKAIIHRDLKPSNILIHLQDDKPIPKIIDFGLAKATAQRLTEKTMFTQLGMVVGTPAYMSPEQSDLTEQNVDTRTDVYSLGVILYELLVGALPFNPQELREVGFQAMLRKIRETDPPRPSTKVRSLGNDSRISAEKRKEEPSTLERCLRGDLDWITMRALEKDKARRYGSPSDLANDIERHLRNEPVLAGPPSASYRAGKFFLRHKFGVMVSAAATLMLISFAVVMALQAQRVARERDRANLEAETSRRVSAFMTGMFKTSDPTEAKGNKITAREILDKGAKEITTGLANQPEVQARLMATMGDVYSGLGLYPQAENLLTEAVDKSRRSLGANHPDTLTAQMTLAWLWDRQGRYADAEKLLLSTSSAQKNILGEKSEAVLQTASALGTVYYHQGRYADADRIVSDALAISRETRGDTDELTWKLIHTLAVAYDGEGYLPKEEQAWRELLDKRQRVLGADHPDTLATMQNLGYVLRREGKATEAEQYLRTAASASTRVLGSDHPDTLQINDNLANVLLDQKRFADAETLQRHNLQARRRVLGEKNPQTLFGMNNLATVLMQENKLDEAESLLQEVLKGESEVLGADHPEIAGILYNLAGVEALKKHRTQALAYLHQAVTKGYGDADELSADDSFISLRSDPEFQSVRDGLRKRATGAAEKH